MLVLCKLSSLWCSDTVAKRYCLSERGVCWSYSRHKCDVNEADGEIENEGRKGCAHVLRKQWPWMSPAVKLLPGHPMSWRSSASHSSPTWWQLRHSCIDQKLGEWPISAQTSSGPFFSHPPLRHGFEMQYDWQTSPSQFGSKTWPGAALLDSSAQQRASQGLVQVSGNMALCIDTGFSRILEFVGMVAICQARILIQDCRAWGSVLLFHIIRNTYLIMCEFLEVGDNRFFVIWNCSGICVYLWVHSTYIHTYLWVYTICISMSAYRCRLFEDW